MGLTGGLDYGAQPLVGLKQDFGLVRLNSLPESTLSWVKEEAEFLFQHLYFIF